MKRILFDRNNRKSFWAGISLLVFILCLTIYRSLPAHTGLHNIDLKNTISTAQLIKLPLRFEMNEGQFDSNIKFLSRNPGYNLYLTGRTMTLVSNSPKNKSVLTVSLRNNNLGPVVTGKEQLITKSNYLIGNNPNHWRTNVANFKRVEINNVYEGIDLVFHGDQSQLEYDFKIQPGADPENIELSVEGAEAINLDQDGNLVFVTKGGQVQMKKPYSYQRRDDLVSEIASRFIIKEDKSIGFEVAAYDRYRELIIDPVLEYATYFGASGEDIACCKIVTDSANNIYLSGDTTSADFPLSNPAQNTFNGDHDIFVIKFDPAGQNLLYSTYLGGSGDDRGVSLQVDSDSNIYLAGGTNSTNFPVLNAYQSSFGGGVSDGYITKLNSNGTINFSTYIGGSDGDWLHDVEIDGNRNIYVAGTSRSSNFPTTAGSFQPAKNGGQTDAILLKLNSSGNALVYSTYIGGKLDDNNSLSGIDEINGLDVDDNGNVYIAGFTNAKDFPVTAGAFQTVKGPGGRTVFVTKFNPAGSNLVYSTFLGGTGSDVANDIEIDLNGNAYILGSAESSDFPVTPGAFQTAKAGGTFDVFVTKLNSLGNQLIYSTYVGGSNNDSSRRLFVDNEDNAWFVGATRSVNYPLQDPVQSAIAGENDAIVTKLSADGATLLFSTVIGGTQRELAYGIIVDSLKNVYIAGETHSSDFPVVNAYQSTFAGGGIDSFIVKIGGIGYVPPVAHAGPDQSKPEGESVMLDGALSTGDNISYDWIQIAGTPVTLDLPDSVKPTFTAPLVPTGGETLTFMLTVDDTIQQSTDTVDITITNVNHAPIADAGDDQLDPGVPEGQLATLDGSHSYDPDNDPFTCAWTQLEGTPVDITSTVDCKAEFLAPPSVQAGGEILRFQLIVYDGILNSEPDEVLILITHLNQPPVADAGGPGPITRDEFVNVTLDGSESFDPEYDPLTYFWEQIAGPGVVINNKYQAVANFDAPAVLAGGENFVFLLTVDDGQYEDTDIVTYHIQNINDAPNCEDARPSSFTLWPPDHNLHLVEVQNLTDPQNNNLLLSIYSVTQDEPVSGAGAGDTSPDAIIQDNPLFDSVFIRGERAGHGNGRVYKIDFTASDGFESCAGSLNVLVPFTRTGTAVDDGQDYDSTIQP